MSVAAIIRRLPRAGGRARPSAAARNSERRSPPRRPASGTPSDTSRGRDEPDDERRCDRDRRERGNGRQLISGSRAAPRDEGAGEQRHARADDHERRDDAEDPPRPHPRRPLRRCRRPRPGARPRRCSRARDDRAIAPLRTGALRQSQRPSARTPPTTSGQRSEPSSAVVAPSRNGAGGGAPLGDRQRRRPGEAEGGRAERREPHVAPPREQHDAAIDAGRRSPAGAPRRRDDARPRLGTALRREPPTPPRARSRRHRDAASASQRRARAAEGAAARARAARAAQLRERAPTASQPSAADADGERAAALPARGGEPTLGDDRARRDRGERLPQRARRPRRRRREARRARPTHSATRATARRRSSRRLRERAERHDGDRRAAAGRRRPDARAPIAPGTRPRARRPRRRPPAAVRARRHRETPAVADAARRPRRRRHRPTGRGRAGAARTTSADERGGQRRRRRRRRAGAAAGSGPPPHRASNASLTLSRSAPSPSAARKTSSREAAPWRARSAPGSPRSITTPRWSSTISWHARAREVQVLGREQDAAASRRERRDGLAEDDDRLGVERRGRLVDEDERRRERERRDRARLPPEAAGERSEPLVAAVVEAEGRQEHVGPSGRPLAGAPEGVHERDELDHASARRSPSARPGRARRQRAPRATPPGCRRRGSCRRRRRADRRRHGAASSCPSRSARRGRRRLRRARRGRRRRAPRRRRSACRRRARRAVPTDRREGGPRPPSRPSSS